MSALDRILRVVALDAGASLRDLCRAAELDPAVDLIGADLTAIDCSGEDLRGFVFDRTNLSHAKLRGADLEHVSFQFADLRWADLTGARTSGADFAGALLAGAVGIAPSLAHKEPLKKLRPPADHVVTVIKASEGRPSLALVADHAPIVSLRGQPVVLDFVLAALLQVETRVLNQAVRRNRDRFPPNWVFEVSEGEFDDLKSRGVISSPTRGGRRSAPLVFTEHGVVLAASVLTSDRARLLMQFVIEIFVNARRAGVSGAALQASPSPVATGFSHRLQKVIERLSGTVLEDKDLSKTYSEAKAVLRSSIDHIRDRLLKAGLENEKGRAEAAKLLAEAEAIKATADKKAAEAEHLKLATLAKKLQLVLSAEAAVSRGEVDELIGVLEKICR